MYKIEWTKKAQDSLGELDNFTSQRIAKKIDELSINPFSRSVKKLKGIQGHRLRVGDYRVIFYVEGNSVFILKIGHRKNIYD